MNGRRPRLRFSVARLVWSGAVVLLGLGWSVVAEEPPKEPVDPRARLSELYEEVFQLSAELARAEDPEDIQELRAELRRLMLEVRELKEEMPEAPEPPSVRQDEDWAEVMRAIDENVNWDEVNRNINEGLEGLSGTLSQLGELLRDATVEIDGNGVQIRDGRGSHIGVPIPKEMKDELAQGFKELQDVWADEETRDGLQESFRRLGEGEAPRIALRNLFKPREERTKTVKKGSIFRFGEDVEIADDLIVDGDVFVFGANAYVIGEVRGNVVVIVGDLFVEDAGQVQNAISAGGKITLDDRNAVHGNMFDLGRVVPGYLFSGGGGFGVIGYAIWLAVLGVMLFLGFAIAGTRVERMADYTRDHAGRSLLGGALWFSVALGAFVVATLGLALTIIGIPVAMILALAFVAALLLSYFASCEVLGARLFSLLGGSRPAATWSAALLGLALLELPGILSAGLGPVDGMESAQMGLRGLDIAIKFFAVALGFGALLATRGGATPNSAPVAEAGIESLPQT